MKKIIIVILSVFLSGCAATTWNNFMYGNPNGANPDYVICPICHTVNDTQNIPLQYQSIQCYYCKNSFNRAEGKKLYNIYVAEYNKAILPAQIIANEQANQAFADRMRNIYDRDRKSPSDYYRQVNPPGSWSNPIYTKEKK